MINIDSRVLEDTIIGIKEEFKPSYFEIFGCFYLGQGYSLASMVFLLLRYINNELSTNSFSTSIGISAIMLFPWYFKVIFGILTDNFPIGNLGRRKPYLVIATFMSLIGWVTLPIHQTANIWFILSGTLLATGAAFGDSVIDAQAVEVTPDEFISRLQGVAWGSRGLGIGAAGIGSSLLVTNIGWDAMFIVSGIFGVTITLIALVLPQASVNLYNLTLSDKIKNIKISIKEIITVYPRFIHLVYFLISGMSIAIVPLFAVLMEKDFNFDISTTGIAALFFAIGSFLGAVSSGIIFDKRDTFAAYVTLIVFYALNLTAGLVFLSTDDFNLKIVFIFTIGITSAAFEAFQLKVIQETSPKNSEGTAFATYTGISNVGQFALGGFLMIYLSELFNLSTFITLQISTVFLVVSIFVMKKMRY